ncbi:GNAT domain-containing protein [Bombardia bombarda]|uniref:GNAT domain-containing protein n=1 Tax=Bombardia bombarda TaxID=252184 RepID=A0AA40BYR6_9PEZI|nr:GNAT domain-containing protein [Bombardia bombarda]
MSAGAPDPKSFVKVRAILPRQPFPLNATRHAFTTDRLILRPLVAEDVEPMHVMCTQPEVMRVSIQGRPDRDLAETQLRLDRFLSPNDAKTFNCAVILRETGEFIGIGGCHSWASAFGWPEIGYMLRKEFWGKGLGSELAKGFVAMWEELPRAEIEMTVDPRTVEGVDFEDGDAAPVVVEGQLNAVTADYNIASQTILKKAGFEHFITWTTEDARPDMPKGTMIHLPTFRYTFGGNLRAGAK